MRRMRTTSWTVWIKMAISRAYARMRLVCLSIPCSTLIFTPSESMTEVMTRNVYLPKHAMLDIHFHTTWKYDRSHDKNMYASLSIPCSALSFTLPESMTEVMTKNVYLPKHSMLDPHLHTTWKYDRSHDNKCIPPKHSMLDPHFHTTWKYDRSHDQKCIPP